MERTAVKSSSIRSVGYDREHRLLDVEFTSGKVYRYGNVPEETHQALMGAESIGAHFGKHIRGKFQSGELIAAKEGV